MNTIYTPLLALVALTFSPLLTAGDLDLTVSVGISPQDNQARRARMESPLAAVELSYTPTGTPMKVYLSHLSSIPNVTDGKGVNQIGLTYTLRLSQ